MFGETCITAEEIGTHAIILEENTRTSVDKDILSEVMDADSDGQHLIKSTIGSDKNISAQNDDKVHQICVSHDEFCTACPPGTESNISTEKLQIGSPIAEKSVNCHETSADVILVSLPESESRDGCDSLAENNMPNTHGSDAIIGLEMYDSNEDMMEIDRKDQAGKPVGENALGVEQHGRSWDDTIELADLIPTVADHLEVKDVAYSKKTPGVVPIREDKLEAVDSKATLNFDDEFKAENISSVTDHFPIAEVTE